MKTSNLFLALVLIFFLSFYACSDKNELLELPEQISIEEIVSQAITSIDEMPEEIQNIIAQSKPYISPQMQELIDMCDTITTVLPIEEVFPFLFSEESHTPALTTKSTAVPTTIFTGMYDYETVLNPIVVSLTNHSSSALRQSLKLTDNATAVIGSSPYRIKFFAVTQNVYFPTPVTNVVALPMADLDKMGINPSLMPATNSINNNTSLSCGFTVQATIPGVLYQFTTYSVGIISASVVDPYLDYIIAPLFGSYVTEVVFGLWGQKLQWRVFVN